jgi:hypothetical protein
MAFDSQNDLFVTQGPGEAIVKITQGGQQSTFATGDTSYQPVGIAIDSLDNVFVWSFNKILEYSPDGLTQSVFATTGLIQPGFIAIPEPSSAALLGFGGLALLRRRRVSR